MFNKNNKDIKKVELKINTLFQNDDVYLSSSFVEMMNNKNNSQQLDENNEYQSNITSYLKNKYENSIKKQYNPIIEELYYNGILSLNNNEYLLKDFFIVYNSELNNFHLKCINSSFEDEEIEYNKAVKFIDTTAFINLINQGNVVNNKLIINSLDTLNNVIKNWDGFLHSEVVDTDSIIDKKMIRDDKDE